MCLFRQRIGRFVLPLLFIFISCSTRPGDPYVLLPECSEAENVSPLFPDSVTLRTMTQSYCDYYDFELVDGRIYSKARGSSNWELFLKTGLPNVGKDSPSAVREISADADTICAFDDQGYMYYCYLAKTAPEKPFRWQRRYGFPKDNQFQQTGETLSKRAWSMGARRVEVLYHEDIYGNPHHWGTMGIETFYFLSEDGRSIRFCDSGLPQDMSHSIQVPEEGRFICENISASASTLFVIGNHGSMYTRMIDFDTMGCDPMFFQYTYDKLEQKYPGTSYFSNYSPWALPAEDWRKQPDIKLKGKARLTKMITIAQNGQGNSARELRVGGTNEDGEVGYYHKMINDSEWSFTRADIHLDSTTFLDSKKPEMAESRILEYNGYLAKNGENLEDVSCKIKGVDLHSTGKCELEISCGEDLFKCTLFLVEKWTYITRDKPGYDGTSRNYFVTAECDLSNLDSYSPEFKELISDMFEGKNHALFAISGEGTEAYFHIELAGGGAQSILSPITGYNDYTVFASSEESTSYSPSTFKYLYMLSQPTLKKSISPELILSKDEIFTVRDREKIEDIIQANEDFIKELKQTQKEINKARRTSGLSRWGYSIIELVTRVTMLNKINFPKIKQVTSFGGDLLASTETSIADMADYMTWSCNNIDDLVSLRIKKYRKLLDEITTKTFIGQVDSSLLDSYPEFYEAAGIPSFCIQDGGEDGITASLEIVDDIPYFPGFFIEDSNDSIVLVILDKSASSLVEWLEKRDESVSDDKTKEQWMKENPIEIKAELLTISMQGRGKSILQSIHDIRYEYNTGNVIWDGENIEVDINTALFSKKVLFKGN